MSIPAEKVEKSSFTPSKIEVQALSVQWLHFKKVQQYIGFKKEKMETHPLGIVVKLIVETYNKTKKDREKESEGFIPYTFNLENTQNYEVSVYGQVEKRKTQLATQLEEGGAKDIPKKTSTNFLLFFYRTKPFREIAAVTTGNSWRAVRACTNYLFPIKVAERILDANRLVEISRRCLVGPNIKETILDPTKHELYKTSTLYYHVESIKCKIKSDSSLIELPFFKEGEEPVITIRTGLLRLHKRISLFNYPCLLALFSKYLYGDKTYNKKGAEEGSDPQFEFLHFLTPVFHAKEELDAQLIKHIFRVYEQGRQQTFYLRHKYLADFLDSTDYEIQYKRGVRYESIGTIPNLEIVMQLILDRGAETPTEKSFSEAFNQVGIRFKDKEGNLVVDRLIDFLEGEIHASEGNSYFKMRGIWFKLAVDYHSLLQEDFRTLLKQVLIKESEEGQLPRSWRGNHRRGKITEVVLKDKFHIVKGIRAFMGELKGTKVSYVNSKNQVMHNRLYGEILKNKVIAKHKDKIEKELLSSSNLPKPEKIKEKFGDDCDAILKELQKQRSILNENKSKEKYVMNPLAYPFKKHSLLKGQYEAFEKFLIEQCEASAVVEDEETYNRTYLHDRMNQGKTYGSTKGYLVFDQICPDFIEPCDVLKYTETTTYLYHIKEDFGQHTRDACSQILNSAREIRSALSTHQAESYLDRLWKKATENDLKGWQAKVKEQLEALNKDPFLQIFHNRKIVFVYAFLEKSNHSIHSETSKKSCLVSSDINLKKKLDKEKIYEALKAEQYLDSRGRLTGKFLACSQSQFKLKGFESDSKDIYGSLSQYKPDSKSTLAKLELIHLARELRALGFDFKICQIKNSCPSSSQLTQEEFSTQSTQVEEPVESEVSPEELFSVTPEPSSSNKMVNGPVGLKNIGNSCYMNAILQALFNVSEIRSKIKAEQKDGHQIVKILSSIMNETNMDKSEGLLKRFRKEVFKIKGKGELVQGEYAQHDAQEFLRIILDLLKWKPVKTHTYFTTKVGNRSSKTQLESHISIALKDKNNFQETLNLHFATEQMKADGILISTYKAVFDGKAHKFREWQQAIRLEAPFPDNLIVHLKRFDNDRRKINQPIQFPANGLVEIKSGDNKISYEIMAYVNHLGTSSSGGHYTSHIKNDRDPVGKERWIHCDDGDVGESQPLNPEKEAYLIFLKKVPVKKDDEKKDDEKKNEV